MRENLVRSRQKNPLETMASGIAHELNNILYPILIYTKLLLENAEPNSEEHADLREILDCAHRAGDLMSKIRMYSGHIGSNKKVSDLVAIITEATKSIRTDKSKTVTFEEQICSNEMPVLCDAGQVTLVLQHLCTNAVQASAETGKIKIGLESATLDKFECFDGTILSGEYASLTVTDNGVGMHQATLARIFDPFFTTRNQATGLGLSAVIGVVRNHNGGISVYSKPEVGTSIEIYLPLAEGNMKELPE
jgi:signal transduction histidine kinase